MKILTAQQTREAENKCFEEYYSEGELMLKAGTACFEQIMKYYGDDMMNKSVAVFCGNGKNAGDGFVISRLLYSKGINAKIVLCDKAPVIPEPLMYYNQSVSSGVEVEMYNQNSTNCDYIIDCIFGIGFHGESMPPFDMIFSDIANCNAKIISIDTPSGCDSTTGKVCKNAVKADLTIAVSTLKYCHILPPSNEHCSKTVVVDIGIPQECYDEKYTKTITFDEVKRSLPEIKLNAHKGSNGKLLCICGSYKMVGAAVFFVESAIRTGVGLVKLVTPKSAYPIIASHTVQSVFCPVDEKNGIISISGIDTILEELKSCDCVVIGCGMGVNDDTRAIVEKVLKNSNVPVIIDADGINSLLSSIDILKDIKVPVVLTPHPSEMARLISKSVTEVQSNRIEISKKFAKEYGVTLVLKGANTVVTDGDSVFVNTTGNPSLAMGGTGDMLCGMIGSFTAQGMPVSDAVKAGVFIHGYNADSACEKFSKRGLTVFDLTEHLRALMSEFEA